MWNGPAPERKYDPAIPTQWRNTWMSNRSSHRSTPASKAESELAGGYPELSPPPREDAMHTSDRRHLLTNAVAAGAAIVAGRWSAATAAADERPKQRIKIGQIGTSHAKQASAR